MVREASRKTAQREAGARSPFLPSNREIKHSPHAKCQPVRKPYGRQHSTFCILLSIVPTSPALYEHERHASFPTPAATSCLDKSPGRGSIEITSPRCPIM